MVEAAGVEPDHLRSTNWLMAHDFRRKVLIPCRFSPSIECPGVPWSRPQSWRHFGDENCRQDDLIGASSGHDFSEESIAYESGGIRRYYQDHLKR